MTSISSKISFWSRLSILIGLGMLFALPAIGQSLPERIARRLERKVERKLERKVEDVIDRKFDESEEKARQKRAAKDSAKTDGVKVSVSEDDEVDTNVEASEFTGRFTMESSTYRNGKMQGDGPTTMTYHVAPYEVGMQLPGDKAGEETVMLFDRRSRKITQKIITKKERTATITRMPSLMVEIEEDGDDGETPDFRIEATGRTKTLEGYRVREYEVESDEMIGLVWVTDEVSLRDAMALGMFSFKGKKSGPGGMPMYYGETVLEAHYEHKDKNESYDYYLRDIRIGAPDPDIFSLDGFEVTDISKFQFGR